MIVPGGKGSSIAEVLNSQPGLDKNDPSRRGVFFPPREQQGRQFHASGEDMRPTINTDNLDLVVGPGG